MDSGFSQISHKAVSLNRNIFNAYDLSEVDFNGRKNNEIRVVYPIAFTFVHQLTNKNHNTALIVFFYDILLLAFRSGLGIAYLWNKKGKLWLQGRKNIFERINSALADHKLSREKSGSQLTWIHCSSLGEFEQGRPVIENLKTLYPNSKILLTFFSPSGFEIRKDYKNADWVFYLPLDTKINAVKFLDAVKPSLVIFVKYDFWYHYLTECRKRKIPLLLISAIFRKEQPFFKWYGSFHRKMLSCFTHFFVQDENSETLLKSIHLNNVTVAGDTRFDRVISIAETFFPIQEIEKFCGNSKVLVAGSTWPNDEKIIREATESLHDLKLIIAPHEIHKEHLNYLKSVFPDSQLFSQIKIPDPIITGTKYASPNCLIIDNIGMLSKLYHYATITYVGGGFDKGIHNVLEAAVHSKPVIFGPKFQKFKEAFDLINRNAGFSISNKMELENKIGSLLNENEMYSTCCDHAKKYVYQNKGATEKII